MGMLLASECAAIVIPGLRSRSPGHLRQQEAIDLNNNIQQIRGSNTLVAQRARRIIIIISMCYLCVTYVLPMCYLLMCYLCVIYVPSTHL